MDARALWHIDPTHSLLRQQTLNKLGSGDCLVQTRYSMVSIGTERLVSRGGVSPAAYGPMKVPYMQGEFSFPLTYGYSLTGEVVDGPQEWLGERVHAMHPHQDRCVIHSRDLTVIPDNIPLDRAILASNMETAVNGVWDGQPMMGHRILVIGYGLIGALIAYLLKPIPGVILHIHEIQPVRQDLASRHGHDVLAGEADLAESYDLIFHTSASAEGLQFAIDHAGMEGRIVEMSWYGDQKVSLEMGASFHYKRNQIFSSQVSHLAIPARPQFDHQRRKDLVFQLLADENLQSYLGECIPFDKSPSFFDDLRKQPFSGLNAYFSYD
ncbi:MAG: zinc-binding alcohol dehydrogenase [Saprospiraceae bacterium]|nr:zinc-binding alcohol dehydrogenase [Saprospiraceae bacterium]